MSTHAPRRSTLRALAGAALVLPLCGCGSSRPVILDTERVERSVEASILAQRQLHAAVSCPSGVVQKKGLRFTCVATVSGRSYQVTVQQTDGHGHVAYVVR